MQGEDFSEVTKHLLKSPIEAFYRTAVKRAYYAVFHVINALLVEFGFTVSDGPQTHRQLLARVNNCGVSELQSLYSALYDLYNRRRKADYDLNAPRFSAQASAALNVASTGPIIAAVKRSQQSQDLRLQIRNGIREYERKINP